MKNKIFIISADVCLNSMGKRKKLDLLTSGDLKPEFRMKLLESDIFAVFKGSTAKVLKTRQYSNISETMLLSRQTLLSKIEEFENRFKKKEGEENEL